MILLRLITTCPSVVSMQSEIDDDPEPCFAGPPSLPRRKLDARLSAPSIPDSDAPPDAAQAPFLAEQGKRAGLWHFWLAVAERGWRVCGLGPSRPKPAEARTKGHAPGTSGLRLRVLCSAGVPPRSPSRALPRSQRTPVGSSHPAPTAYEWAESGFLESQIALKLTLLTASRTAPLLPEGIAQPWGLQPKVALTQQSIGMSL